MRLIASSLCVVALAGCSDAAPTEHAPPVQTRGRLAVGGPNDAQPKPATRSTTAALPPLLTRVEWLVGARVDNVTIPPDDYSQSSDAVHPDMACPSGSWNGRRCWLIYTPYHNGDSHYENPSVLYAENDTSWDLPPSVRNPLIPYPGPARYNSDPDHAFDPVTHRMVQVYRVVGDTTNTIMLMSTGDALHWTKPVVAFRERVHDAVSPSLVIESDRTAKIWYVQSGISGCDSRSTTVQLRTAAPDAESGYERSTWSAATPVTMSIPNYMIWHLDVVPLEPGQGYLALIVAFPRNTNCANSDLWLGWSADGLTWTTHAVPILWRTMAAARNRNISTWYRGTMRSDAASGMLHIWPSALSGSTWTVYHTSVKLADLLALLRSAKPADFQPSLLVRTNHMRLVDMP